MTMSEADEKRAFSIFSPIAAERMAQVESLKTKFVHYTSADAALSILRNREVWLRNARYMNDYREVDYGLENIIECYRSPVGQKLQALLNRVRPGIVERFNGMFERIVGALRYESYILCISEHGDVNGDSSEDSEDEFGRLSMWRAYAAGYGVAVVLNPECFFSPTDALESWTSPVSNLSQKKFQAQFGGVVEGIEQNFSFIEQMPEEDVVKNLHHMFVSAALCTKHPGFHEEREWRIVYHPTINESGLVRDEILSLRGLPQRIYKIKLEDVPEKNLVGINPRDLIHKIIIGPNQHPLALYDAFTRTLRDMEVPEYPQKVAMSFIPLR